MKTALLILLLVPLFGLSQTTNIPTGVMDSNLFRHWENYLDDCNKLVPDTIKQSGVVNVKYKPVIVNGEISHYILSPIDTVWTDCKCGKYKYYDNEYLTLGSGSGVHWINDESVVLTSFNRITYTPVEQVNNKISITRNKICMIKKRKASWDDFWDRWLVEKKIIELN